MTSTLTPTSRARLGLPRADSMAEPASNLFQDQEPLGFRAGDGNLYRYVKNNPTNRTAPSGLQPPSVPLHSGNPDDLRSWGPRPNPGWTEARALEILKAQIKTWRAEGKQFAANLLQHFIDRKGPEQYKPTPSDIEEVKRESKPLIVSFILDKRYRGELRGSSFSFAERVRWISDSVIGIVDSIQAGEHIRKVNEPLFAAYGGDRLAIKGTISNSKLDKYRGCITFDATAEVTLSDTYEFGEPGPGSVRLLFPAYSAANSLQTKYGYKPFDHKLTFTHTYSVSTSSD